MASLQKQMQNLPLPFLVIAVLTFGILSIILLHQVSQNSELARALKSKQREAESLMIQVRHKLRNEMKVPDFGEALSDRDQAVCSNSFAAAMLQEQRDDPLVLKVANHTPDAKTFFRKFLSASRPVLLQGVAKKMPAVEHWTDEYLETAAGNYSVEAEIGDDSMIFEIDHPDHQNMNLSEYLQGYRRQKDDAKKFLYLAEEDLPRPLAKDVKIPHFASFLDLEHVKIWLGRGKEISALHAESVEQLFIQVAGTKKVSLWSPLERVYMYPKAERPNHSQVDPMRYSKKDHPLFAKAQRFDAVLRPGDMLFVPAFWWTYTRNGADRHVTTAMWFSPHTNIGHAAWSWYEDLGSNENEDENSSDDEDRARNKRRDEEESEVDEDESYDDESYDERGKPRQHKSTRPAGDDHDDEPEQFAGMDGDDEQHDEGEHKEEGEETPEKKN